MTLRKLAQAFALFAAMGLFAFSCLTGAFLEMAYAANETYENATGVTSSVDYLTAPTAVALSASQAEFGWGTCENAVLVPEDCGALILSAASLAGALDCPIITVSATGAPDTEVLPALSSLGAKNIYIVAAAPFNAMPFVEAVASEDALAKAEAVASGTSYLVRNVVVISGDDVADTSTCVMRFGIVQNLWHKGQVLVANSADATAAAACEPFAYHEKSPVLLTGADGKLTGDQRAWLVSGGELCDFGVMTAITILDTPGLVSDEVLSFAALTMPLKRTLLVRKLEGDGATLVGMSDPGYPITSETLLLTDTTQATYGSTRLMAERLGMDILLIDDEDAYQTMLDLLNGGTTHLLLTCVGDPVDEAYQQKLGAVVDRINRTGKGQLYVDGCDITYWSVGVTLAAAAEKQVGLSVNDDWEQVEADEIAECMDPTATPIGTKGFCQFLNLSGGYTGLITADQLDAFIESYIPAIESSTGYTSPFHGMGATLIKAARESNINEVYLLAHAIVECGAGCSHISTLGGYYNFYGIAAYDSNPYASGDFAEGMGWKTAEEAILGGAAWISEHYVNSDTYQQNTVYQMRWCAPNANHEYCSANSFPVKVGAMMEMIYASAGVDVANAGLSFSIPVYD